MNRRINIILLLSLIMTACSSNKSTNRNLSSEDSISEEATEAYYKKRGNGWSKFEYDGFSARKNPLKLGKTLANKENREFIFELSERRGQLNKENLFDTGVTPNPKDMDCDTIMAEVHRTPYGECYFHNYEEHLSDKDKKLANQLRMGAINERFGRNVSDKVSNKALEFKKDLMIPNPLEVSQKLLHRKNGKQVDAPVINVLATAWLQAMNHDWFTHGKNSKKKSYTIDAHHAHGDFKDGMKIPATQSESDSEKKVEQGEGHSYHYVSRNRVTHWWDASQIYGSDPETIKKVRGDWSEGASGEELANGKIAVDTKNRRLRYDSKGLPITGFHDNWWVGLELIHTLFHLEHNSIIDNILKPNKKELCAKKTKAECGDIFFEKARMINSALIAKIHTVEWTPALLDNEILHAGMRANWYGMIRELSGLDIPFIRDFVGKKSLAAKHVLSGLTGEKTLDLYSVPFTLTEEFVAVYRMHPLVPDFVTIRDSKSNKAGNKVSTKEMIFRKAQGTMSQYGSATWLNSFGTSFPGAMALHNHPSWMKNFVAERNTGKDHDESARMDMGAIDIFRDRERGVPRYNDFRKALNLPPAKSFEDLTPVKADQEVLAEVYEGDIEKVDLLVGTLAEKDRYPGFAFGNTPFYIFALMASRRLMADPFFSDYYTPKYYTQGGIDHVQDTDMTAVILRHFPEFKERFYVKSNSVGRRVNYKKVVKNAFRPWLSVYKDVEKAIEAPESIEKAIGVH